MKREVFYLMSGAAHCPYLLCSLWTLRQHYDGPVVVHAWDESFDICRQIAEDSRLSGIEVRLSNPPEKIARWRKNRQFAHKIWLALQKDADPLVRLYLDADTTIHGNLDRLFLGAEKSEMFLTQFNGWNAKGGIVEGRIERTRGHLPEAYHQYIDYLKSASFPSVNGGVWAAQAGSSLLQEWLDMTEACRKIFIPDEACLHVLAARWYNSRLAICKGGLYNMSARVKFWPPGTKMEDIRVLHYHGDSNCRPDKAPQGAAFWNLIWQQAKKLNLGNVLNWRGQIRNKHLDRFEAALADEETCL